MSQNESRNSNPSRETGENGTNTEDLEAALKAESERRVSTPKLTTFSAVIDEVMPQIQEQRASLRVIFCLVSYKLCLFFCVTGRRLGR